MKWKHGNHLAVFFLFNNFPFFLYLAQDFFLQMERDENERFLMITHNYLRRLVG